MNINAFFKTIPLSLSIQRLLLLLIFVTACTTQNKTKESATNHWDESKQGTVLPPETSAVALPESGLPVEDPTFVMSKDTISAHGPRSITRNVLEDKNGNIWLASWEGIISYDGKLFTNFTLKKGLRHVHVFSILEDRTGNLWFGTIGGGVYRCDAASHDFTYFTTANGLAGNTIMYMLEDRTGNIWFGTFQDGVSRYDGKAFTNFTMQDGLSSNSIGCIEQDKTGKLWFGTNFGINCYDPSAAVRPDGKSFTNFTNEKDSSFYRVTSITEDNSDGYRKDNIWIGSANGLCRYDPSASDGNRNRTGGKSFTWLTSNSPMNIFQDKKGNLWLSDGEVNSSEMHLTKYDGKSFIKIKSDKQIFGVTEDRMGNIWFGTQHGVYRYNPSVLKTGGKSFTDFKD